MPLPARLLAALIPTTRAESAQNTDTIESPIMTTKDKKLSDEKAILPPPTTTEENKAQESPDSREQAIREKLARVARVPAEAVFECVPFPILWSWLHTNGEFFHISLIPGTSPLGLMEEAALSAFEKHGPNIFASDRAPRALSLLMAALANPFNFILVALAVISFGTGDKPTFAVMMAMIVASTGLRCAPPNSLAFVQWTNVRNGQVLARIEISLASSQAPRFCHDSCSASSR